MVHHTDTRRKQANVDKNTRYLFNSNLGSFYSLIVTL